MTTSTERLVRTLCALANQTETEVDLGTVLIVVLLERLLSNTFGVSPSGGVPLERVPPEQGVDLGNGSTGEDHIALGNDVRTIFGGGSEGAGDNDIVTEFTHDTVDGRVHTEGLTDNSIENGE